MKTKINTEIFKIVSFAMLIAMLFSVVASAKIDIHADQQGDNVKFVVKNVGENPMYVLNALTALDDKGNTIYTSQEPSSAEVLRINPGVSYTFEWNTDDVPEGTYIGKIYQGNDKRTVSATSTNFVIKQRPVEPRFYTNKISYKYGENVDVIFKNMGFGAIYVNVNNWKITNLDKGIVVDTLSQECTFGYGGCGDSFEPLGSMQQVRQTWDQKDSNGDQVSPGNYMVTAEYTNNNPSSGTPDIKTISTRRFIIRPPRK